MFDRKMRNRAAQHPQSFSSYGSLDGEYVVPFPELSRGRNIPCVVSVYSLRNTTTAIIRDLNHQDLIKKIFAFTLSVIATLFSSLGEQTLRTKPGVETVFFFLIIAFSASLSTFFSSHREGKAALVLECAAVTSTALAFASVASMYLRLRFQLVAYGFCVLVPLLMVARARCEGLLWNPVVKAIRRWWNRTISGNYRSSRGRMVIPY